MKKKQYICAIIHYSTMSFYNSGNSILNTRLDLSLCRSDEERRIAISHNARLSGNSKSYYGESYNSFNYAGSTGQYMSHSHFGSGRIIGSC